MEEGESMGKERYLSDKLAIAIAGGPHDRGPSPGILLLDRLVYRLHD
jgi:hypothetical protein